MSFLLCWSQLRRNTDFQIHGNIGIIEFFSNPLSIIIHRLLLCPNDCGKELDFPAVFGLERRKLRCLEQMIPVLAPVRTIHCPKCIPMPMLARSQKTLSAYSHHLVKNLTDMARNETPWENKTNTLFFRGTVYRTCNSSMIKTRR